MKKRYLSYFLLVAFVLVMASLLSQTSAAQDTGSVATAVSPLGAGSVVVTPLGGQQVKIEAFPVNSSYIFSHWTDNFNNIPVPDANPTDFTVIDDHTVTAHFTLCYTLSVASDPSDPVAGGSISVPGDAKCPAGKFEASNPPSTPTITATANDGFQFDNWTGTPSLTGTTNESAIQIPMNGDRTVTAHFSTVCQTVTLKRNSAAGGTIPTANPLKISCPDNHDFRLGESTTLTAVPITGWKVADWTVDGSDFAPTGNTHLLIMKPLAAGAGLDAQVNYGEKATFGFSESTVNPPEAENGIPGKVQIAVNRDTSTLPEGGVIQYTTVELPGEATADVDYVAKSGSLTFSPTDQTKTIVIDLIDDQIKEGPESFEIRLSENLPDIKLGASTIVVQIADDEGDPTVRFSQSVYTANEPIGPSATVTIAVTVFPLPATGDVTVRVKTNDDTATEGEDYTAYSKRIPIPVESEGLNTTTIDLTIFGDDLDEEDEETVTLSLSSASNAVIAPDSDAVLKIVDDDLPPLVGFSKSEFYIKKAGNTEALIPVNLSVPSGQKVKVDYKVTHEQSGNVQEDTLSFDAGSQMETIPIPITSANPEDVFTLQLIDPQKAELATPDTASLYVLSTDISDCHALTLTFNGYGQAPAATSKASSAGCPGGQYVAGELIDIVAQPERGWYVSGWQGTIDDESSSMQNTVEMPNKAYAVNASYRIPVYFSILNYDQPSFIGSNENEPNNLFSQANGPMVFGKNYYGAVYCVSNLCNDPTKDDWDLFYFQLGVEASVAITLADIPNNNDYDLRLYNEDWKDGKFIDESREGGTKPEVITKTLQPGKYWIQVFANNGELTTAKYRLRVNAN